jgi:hypothetical protein
MDTAITHMNTNVGNMPLDIFSDYISDILGEEWSWEYLVFAVNGMDYHYSLGYYGHGYGHGHSYIENDNGYGYGTCYNNGIGYQYEMNFVQRQAKGCGVKYTGNGSQNFLTNR